MMNTKSATIFDFRLAAYLASVFVAMARFSSLFIPVWATIVNASWNNLRRRTTSSRTIFSSLHFNKSFAFHKFSSAYLTNTFFKSTRRNIASAPPINLTTNGTKYYVWISNGGHMTEKCFSAICTIVFCLFCPSSRELNDSIANRARARASRIANNSIRMIFYDKLFSANWTNKLMKFCIMIFFLAITATKYNISIYLPMCIKFLTTKSAYLWWKFLSGFSQDRVTLLTANSAICNWLATIYAMLIKASIIIRICHSISIPQINSSGGCYAC